MRKILALAIILIIVCAANGQNIVFSLKDKSGNLWFSVSERGVFRFDGNSFSRFTGNVGSGLISSCIYEDRSGKLWFKTNDGGLCIYDGKNYTRFVLPLPDSSLVGTQKYRALSVAPVVVSHMLQDKKGNFWFLAGMHGVYRYDAALTDSLGHERSFSYYFPGDSWPVWPVCILESSHGEILVGSWDQSGLHRFNGTKFTAFAGFSDGMIFSISEDRAGSIWVGTRIAGVDRWDGKCLPDGTAIVTNFSKKDGLENNVTGVLQDSKGNIWFGTNWNNLGQRGDAFLYDGKAFSNVTANEKAIKFADFAVRSLVEDNNGNVWIGSKNGILLRYDGRSFTDFSKELLR